MPIYEYRCTKCAFQFEVKRGFGEISSAPCPRCQGEAHRVFSPVPVIFRAPGFYTTDSRKEERSEPWHEAAEGSPKAESESEEE